MSASPSPRPLVSPTSHARRGVRARRAAFVIARVVCAAALGDASGGGLGGGLEAQAPTPPAAPRSAAESAALRDEPLAPAATQGDLAQLDRALRTLHPGLFRYTTPEQWSRRVDSLRAWFAVPRTRGESFVAFSRLVASVRCSHTYLSFWNQPRAVHTWLTDAQDKLPFEYRLVAGDRWVVERSATFLEGVAHSDDVLPGDTIETVNGVSTPALIAELLPLIRGDGDNDGKRRGLLDFRHRKEFEAIDVFLPLLHPPVDGRYAITLRRNGRRLTRSVASVASAQRRREARPVPAARPMHELTIVDGVATLRVDAFDYGRDADKWAPFVTASFQRMRDEGVRALVLDIRENEGGSDEGAEFLLRHLLRAPFVLPPLRRFVKYEVVPEALRPVLSTWDRAFYDRRGRVAFRGDGTYDITDDAAWPDTIPVAADAFRGDVFILTSPVNSSASHFLLRFLKGRPGVTLVGEESGGSLRAHTGGNLFFATYPGTGFEIDLPLIAYDWGAAQPSRGVLPDVAVPSIDAMAVARRLIAARASGTP